MNMSMDFTGRKITVIGLGKSGCAVARLLRTNGAEVQLSELDDNSLLRAQAQELEKIGIEVELGAHSKNFFESTDVIVPSPGVKPTSEPIQWAKENGIPIYSEMEVAYRFCPSGIIAITGTNGKTTVTTLVGQMLKNAGRPVVVGGNIGIPLSDLVSQVTPSHWTVLEVSSFQLEYIEQFKPRIAVILNFTTDHLDHHRDVDEYFAMKARITQNQKPEDWLVLNARDTRLQKLIGKTHAQIRLFNHLGGKRNANDNTRAVALIGEILDIPTEIIDQTLQNFKGVKHRLEEVAIVDGIRFINDSKSTNVDSLRWALQNVPSPIHLIAGGRDKGGDFSELSPLIREKTKRILLIGEAKEKLQGAWKDLGIPMTLADSLKSAILLAYRESPVGTNLLLSPGCASFDMFRNYEDRGDQFKAIVYELLHEHRRVFSEN